MVTLETAENALKEVYLGVISNTLNLKSNPFLAKIKQSTADVWGKEIVKLAPYGINGGIGAGTEDGGLPSASGNNYVQFKSTLKNLYGTIEISDKAIRASQNNAGAFVNLLNAEMEGLINASVFNLSRMLYGDGSGILTNVASVSSAEVTVGSTNNLMEGMLVEFGNSIGTTIYSNSLRKIIAIDRINKKITLDSNPVSSVASGSLIFMQNSKDKEITGLKKIFNASSLYGVSTTTHPWMKPYVDSTSGAITDARIQNAIDYIQECAGTDVDFITCSNQVRRYYQEYLSTYRRNIDYMDLQGGFKAISYAGIPVVGERFVDSDTMMLLNSKDFTLHQLCDWQWLEGEDGRIIKQKQGYPVYYATLVKYADLICDRPNAQAKITNITQATSTTTTTTTDSDDDEPTGDAGE